MRGFRAIVVTAALAAVIVLLVIVFRTQIPRFLAYHWRGQLATATEERCRQLLGQIGGLDEVGIPILVHALGSSRECVARGAKQVLNEHFDRWLTLPPDEVSPKLRILAQSLAEEVEGFGPTARRDAEELASWILRWRPDSELVDRANLIASCRKVLEVTEANAPIVEEEGEFAAQQRALGDSATLEMPPSLLRDLGARDGSSIADLARLPGGGLGIDSSPVAEMPPTLLEPSGRIASQAGPTSQHGNNAPSQPELVALGPLSLNDNQSPSNGNSAATDGQSQLSSGSDRSAKERGHLSANELMGADTLDLMRRLRTSGGDNLAQIRAELMRRGFSEVHLALATRLFDPDPEVRADTARRLPELQSVDAVPWLLWLCEDSSPDVRLTAVTLLATTGDPALLRQVEQIARRDNDSRVRKHAERIAQQNSRTWK